MLEAADDAADPDEPVEVGRELGAVDVAGMAGRVGEGDAVLVEIVGDGELAAEGVPAALDVDFIDFVVARLQQNGNVQARFVDEFGNRDLVAEIRQANDEAVDGNALVAKEGRILARVVTGLNRAVLGCVDRQDLGHDIQPLELPQQLRTGLKGWRAVEKLPAADHQSEFDRAKIALCHGLRPAFAIGSAAAPADLPAIFRLATISRT